MLIIVTDGKSQIVKIEFKTFTRGFQKEAFFTADSLIQITNKCGVMDVSKRKIDTLEWQKLQTAIEQVQEQKIAALPSPSSRRAFDGAMHSSITLINKDNASYTHSFDDEYPHEDLLPLMEVISSIIGENIER